MLHYYCPCEAILNPNSTIRFLKLSSPRLFISNRTMRFVSLEAKVCNACRTAYYTWKSNNTEFGNIFSRIEQKTIDAEEIINMNLVNRDFVWNEIYSLFILYIIL